MEPAQPNDDKNFIPLRKAAELFSVTVDTLLEWNENNILKPTISQDGKVGYTQEQIDKFLSLQKIFIKEDSTPTPSDTYRPMQQESINSQSKNQHNKNTYKENYSSKSHIKQIKTNPSKYTLFAYGLSSCLVAMLITTAVIASSSNTENNSLDNSSGSQAIISQASHSRSKVLALHKDEAEKQSGTKITAPENEIDTPFSVLADSSEGIINNYEQQIPNSKEQPLKDPGNIIVNGTRETNANHGVNFASRPNTTTTSKETLFDNNGNLRRSNDNDTLAASIGTSTLNYNPKTTKNSLTTNIIFVSLIFGLLWAVYAFNTQHAFITTDNNTMPPIGYSNVNSIQDNKILAVTQKMDGTVIIYFRGDEFKVSKPELNSETDRFIQRILEITSDGGTEIEYDILEDEKLNLNAPLSKIVTRLGFVGIKRDLFFPRTSKNKVVFRKYLTDKEFKNLKLDEDQILSELSS